MRVVDRRPAQQERRIDAAPHTTLPAMVRRTRFDADEERAGESALAHRHFSAAALRALPAPARRHAAVPSTVAHLKRDISDRVAGGEGAARRGHSAHQLETALLSVKRQALSELRDVGRIDDIVLRGVQDVLDAEAVRLPVMASRMPPVPGKISGGRPPRDEVPTAE